MKRVYLPDGTYVAAPDDADEKDVRRWAAEKFPDAFPDKSPSSNVWQSIKKGVAENVSLAADVIPAMVGRAVGADDYAEKQWREAAETQEYIKKNYPKAGQYQGIESIMDPTLGGSAPGRALGWLNEAFWENIPSMIPTLGLGAAARVGTNVIAGKATREALEGLSKKELARLEAKQAAEQAAGRASAAEAMMYPGVTDEFAQGLIPRAASVDELGTAARLNTALSPEFRTAAQAAQNQPWMRPVEYGSLFGGSAVLNVPESYQSIRQDTGEESPGAALLIGSVKSALDSILPGYVLDKVLKTNTAEAIAKSLVAKGSAEAAKVAPAAERGFWKSIAAEAGKGAAIEGVTEGTQEALDILGAKFVNDNFDVFNKQNLYRVLESAIVGGLTGGVFGGIGGGVSNVRTQLEPKAREFQDQQKAATAEAVRQRYLGNVGNIEYTKKLGDILRPMMQDRYAVKKDELTDIATRLNTDPAVLRDLDTIFNKDTELSLADIYARRQAEEKAFAKQNEEAIKRGEIRRPFHEQTAQLLTQLEAFPKKKPDVPPPTPVAPVEKPPETKAEVLPEQNKTTAEEDLRKLLLGSGVYKKLGKKSGTVNALFNDFEFVRQQIEKGEGQLSDPDLLKNRLLASEVYTNPKSFNTPELHQKYQKFVNTPENQAALYNIFQKYAAERVAPKVTTGLDAGVAPAEPPRSGSVAAPTATDLTPPPAAPEVKPAPKRPRKKTLSVDEEGDGGVSRHVGTVDEASQRAITQANEAVQAALSQGKDHPALKAMLEKRARDQNRALTRADEQDVSTGWLNDVYTTAVQNALEANPGANIDVVRRETGVELGREFSRKVEGAKDEEVAAVSQELNEALAEAGLSTTAKADLVSEAPKLHAHYQKIRDALVRRQRAQASLTSAQKLAEIDGKYQPKVQEAKERLERANERYKKLVSEQGENIIRTRKGKVSPYTLTAQAQPAYGSERGKQAKSSVSYPSNLDRLDKAFKRLESISDKIGALRGESAEVKKEAEYPKIEHTDELLKKVKDFVGSTTGHINVDALADLAGVEVPEDVSGKYDSDQSHPFVKYLDWLQSEDVISIRVDSGGNVRISKEQKAAAPITELDLEGSEHWKKNFDLKEGKYRSTGGEFVDVDQDTLWEGFKAEMARDFSVENRPAREALYGVIRQLLLKTFKGDEDIVGNAILSAMRQFSSYTGKEPFTHWLNAIARRKKVDLQRTLARAAEDQIVDITEEDGKGVKIDEIAEDTVKDVPDRARQLQFRNDLINVMYALLQGEEGLQEMSGPRLRGLLSAAENLSAGAYGAHSSMSATNWEFGEKLHAEDFTRDGMNAEKLFELVKATLPKEYYWAIPYVQKLADAVGLKDTLAFMRTYEMDRDLLARHEVAIPGSYYHSGVDTIYLAASDFANPEIALHEIVHALTVKYIDAVQKGKIKPDEKIAKSVKHLEDLRKAVQAYFKKQGILDGVYDRATQDIKEFVSYAMSDQSFKRALENTPPAIIRSLTSDKSWVAKAKDLLRHIWSVVRDLFGIPNEKAVDFDQVLAGVTDFMNDAAVYRNKDMLPNSSFGGAPSWAVRNEVMEDMELFRRETSHESKLLRQGMATMKALMSGKFADKIPANVAAWLYKALSLPQLGMWGQKLFINRPEYGIRPKDEYAWRLLNDADLMDDYVLNVRRLQGLSQYLKGEMSTVVRDLESWKKHNPQVYEGVTNVMYESSRFMVNPRRTWEDNKARLQGEFPGEKTIEIGTKEYTLDDLEKKYNEIKADYDALVEKSRVAEEMWLRVENYYNSMRSIILDAVYQSAYEAAQSPELGMAAVMRARERLEIGTPDKPRMAIDPYIRFVRTGNYYLRVEFKDGEVSYQAYNDEELARRAKAHLEITHPDKIKELTVETREDFMRGARPHVSRTFVMDMIETLQQSEAWKNASEAQKKEMENLLYDTYIETLPEVSIAKALSKRKGYEGFNKDLVESITDYGSRITMQIPRILHGNKLEMIYKRMDQMYRWVYAKGEKENDEHLRGLANRMNAYLQILSFHLQDSREGKPNQLVRTAQRLSWYFYLAASPAAASLQLLQTAFITFPFLAGRYGFKDAASMMLKGAGDFFSGRLYHKTGERNVIDGLLSMTASPNLTVLERKAASEFLLSNTFNEDESYELTQKMTEELAKSDTDRFKRMASHATRYLFHNAERFNREVSAMTTFRLEYARARKEGKSEEVAFNEAVRRGREVVSLTHGDYTYLMAPGFFKGNTILQMMLIFKKFPQMMAFLMADTVKRASSFISSNEDLKQRYGIKDEDVKAFRSEARKQLAGILGFSFFASGMAGLPLYGAIKVILEAMFDDDDEPWDFDLEMRKLMPEILFRGPLNSITGIDFAQRLELSNMWWRDPKMGQDRSFVQNLVETLGGPALGIGVNYDAAADLIKKGKVERGWEMMMPLAARNGMKAYRFAMEDATNVNGAKIKEINGAEVLVQLFGYTPAELARTYRENTWKLQFDRRLQEQHNILLSKLNMAAFIGDNDKYNDILQDMKEFGQKYPAYAFSGDTLQKSRKEFYRRRAFEANVGQGTYVDPKKWPKVREYLEGAIE